MLRALAIVLIFDFVTAVPRIGLPFMLPARPPESAHPQMPVDNRFGRRRAAKLARAA